MNTVMESKAYRDFSAVVHQKAEERGEFIKAQIELTYRCNLHCVHCYTDPLNRPELLRKELSYEEVLRALDKLAIEGILWVCFTGGEIFMRRDFLKIYDHAIGRGFVITLLTNGTLVTDAIADHLAGKRPFSIEISLHGATPKTFDKITQTAGSFDRCLAGIRTLLKRKLPLKIKTKVMTLNQNELDQIQNLVESFGLRYQANGIIYPRLDGDASSTLFRLDPERLTDMEFAVEPDEEECCKNLTDAAPEELGIGLETPKALYRCGCGKLQLHMDPYGKVGACTWSRKNRFDFREKSLQQGMRELSTTLRSETYKTQSPCYSCKAVYHCDKLPEFSAFETAATEQDPVPYFCNLAFQRYERAQIHLNHASQFKKDALSKEDKIHDEITV